VIILARLELSTISRDYKQRQSVRTVPVALTVEAQVFYRNYCQRAQRLYKTGVLTEDIRINICEISDYIL
jgi:hypothetical protein